MHHMIQLINKKEVARGTIAFMFTKPKKFSYRPGHYVDMTIPRILDPEDPDNIRSFSLTSAPYESSLIITVRIRESAFKQTLNALKPGDTVDIEGPKGEFILPNNKLQCLVMLAGGIGITPFYSMLRQCFHEQYIQQFVLLYSNRTHLDAPFLEELTHITSFLNVTFMPVFTQEGDGHINEALLTRLLGNTDPLYYIAGPPAMVGGMQALLYRLKVSPDRIRLDEFTGY